MLLYIGCHSASPPPHSLCNWLMVSLPVSLPLCFPKTLFAQVDSDTVLNEPHSFPPLFFFLRALAVDCVIESESRGACGELEVEAPTSADSGREGSRKSGDKHRGGGPKLKWRGKCKYNEVRGINRGWANKGDDEVWV